MADVKICDECDVVIDEDRDGYWSLQFSGYVAYSAAKITMLNTGFAIDGRYVTSADLCRKCMAKRTKGGEE